MKKINKKGIAKLIILIILLITQIKAFKDSRANNITYVTANIIDASGLLSAETSSIIAMNEGESGMAITLPDILNTKKVNKYIVTKKTIIETIVEPEETEQVEETTTEPEETEQVEETTTESEEIEQIEDTTTEPDVTEQVEETTTEPTELETTQETIIENVEKLPGEKVYLTQEEIELLIKEKERLIASITRRENLLNNENYVSKAPSNIVDNDRKMLEKEKNDLKLIEEKLGK